MAEYTKNLPFPLVNKKIIGGMGTPGRFYTLVMLFLFLVVGWGFLAWLYQVKMGMGVAGINHPVGWGAYITNFVFWVGIAHSGTLISAILYLVRSKWRDAVSRSTEAMTVIAVLTAGMFPLIHLGRLWVFYYILPYPNQRELWPNFMSPLVLDLLAIFTYLNVSVIFFYFGLIPDAAAVRDHYFKKLGASHWKTKLFKAISLGWSGALHQWRHYNRSYLYFAMLATPLVVSVHSIVSWDFAVSLLPGWHSTIFPPYFVAGAIHSGLAMALTLLIPMRKLLGIDELITTKHLHAIAKLMLLTTLIIAYAYVVEPFIESFSGSVFHSQFSEWRATGPMAWIYYLTLVLNVLVPLTFLFPKIRARIGWLFLASILINVGMWMERYLIVVGATAHDYMPHNWGSYVPSWVEISISAGMAAFFIFFFMGFAKFLPVVSIADFKDYLLKGRMHRSDEPFKEKTVKEESEVEGEQKMLVFQKAGDLVHAVEVFAEKGFRKMETFSPVKVPEVEQILGVERSPVRYWTTLGGILGVISGYALTVGTANNFSLIVGGKHPSSLFTYVLVMFELAVLFATYFNFISSIYYTKLYQRKIHKQYDTQFSTSEFGLLLSYSEKEKKQLQEILNTLNNDQDHEKE